LIALPKDFNIFSKEAVAVDPSFNLISTHAITPFKTLEGDLDEGINRFSVGFLLKGKGFGFDSEDIINSEESESEFEFTHKFTSIFSVLWVLSIVLKVFDECWIGD